VFLQSLPQAPDNNNFVRRLNTRVYHYKYQVLVLVVLGPVLEQTQRQHAVLERHYNSNVDNIERKNDDKQQHRQRRKLRQQL
jgi:hypothetical protein